MSNSYTESAFRDQGDQDLDTPDSPYTEGTFTVTAPTDQLPGPRIEAKSSQAGNGGHHFLSNRRIESLSHACAQNHRSGSSGIASPCSFRTCGCHADA
jgi:hypothetical protein